MGRKGKQKAEGKRQEGGTRRYRTRRRLIVPGVGDFPRGAECELTDEQYRANQNSLIAFDPPGGDAAADDTAADGEPDAGGGTDDGG